MEWDDFRPTDGEFMVLNEIRKVRRLTQNGGVLIESDGKITCVADAPKTAEELIILKFIRDNKLSLEKLQELLK